jgi:hypothetical protein
MRGQPPYASLPIFFGERVDAEMKSFSLCLLMCVLCVLCVCFVRVLCVCALCALCVCFVCVLCVCFLCMCAWCVDFLDLPPDDILAHGIAITGLPTGIICICIYTYTYIYTHTLSYTLSYTHHRETVSAFHWKLEGTITLV